MSPSPRDVASTDAFFVRTGVDSFMPTDWTRGAWNEDEQHFSPIGGLLTHVIDQYVAARGDATDTKVAARLSFDILGVVALEPMHVRVTTLRPGRTIELIEATISAGGRDVVRGRVWRMQPHDTLSVSGGAASPLAHPDSIERWPMDDLWPGRYIRSLDVRILPDPPRHPGRACAWIRSDVALVADEPVSPLAHFVRLVDTANGIAVRESPREWMFPNLDLTIHLHRQPAGDWTGFDTTVVFGPTGQGLTSTTLHDVTGPVGRAEQILTVRPMRHRDV